MTELEEKIKNFADNYYQGNELISDAEYDALIEQLKKENPNSEILKGVVGTDLKGISKKYKLPHCMNTLAKCADEKEFKEWWDKHPHDDYMVSLKIDGNSQLLEYKNGKFVRSLSRGNGEEGEDTTANVSKIVFPKNIENFNGYIRGEVYLQRSVWSQYFPDTKNPRNCCAGIIKRLDGEGCDKLSFCAYEVFDNDNVVDKTEVSKFKFLEDNGFEVALHEHNLPFEKIVEWKNNLNPNGEIPCDGLVYKQNKVSKEDTERQVPLNMCAFKPNLQIATTILKDISWEMKGRYVSPVAILEPVELEGATITRASLANINIMNSLGVYIGATVFVKRAGLIIPQIEAVLEPKKKAFNIPTTCPACGRNLILNESGMVECINECCPRKVGHRFKKMFKVFGIKGCGDAFVDNLENAGITVEDFLEMCANKNPKCFNTYAGGINGEKIYKQMREVMGKQISAAKFLAIFDEPMLDEKRFLLFGNKTLGDLMFLSCKSKEEIMKFKGIGEEIADAYINFFNKNKEEIAALRQYFTFESVYDIIEENNNGGKKMSMPTICFTGSCAGFTRKELTEKCQGKYDVKDSVTKDLDYLACADPNSGSSKLQKAMKNGTKIISYTELLQSL
jgi:DNA ligase (NAD+)